MVRRIIAAVLLAASCLGVAPMAGAQRVARRSLPRLRVSESGRFLVTEDGRPFFYLGDTAWELFHRLTREDAVRYLQFRADQGYTAIQAVALAEFDGLTVPNAYGDLPLVDRDPARPATTPGSDPADAAAYDYWDHVDFIVNEAEQRGLHVAMLPTWGRWVINPQRPADVAFDEAKAESYGRFIGKRYASHPIIWVLGGDRGTDGVEKVWRAMARGIAIGTSGREDYTRVMMTFHPCGACTSSTAFHDDAWLDFNMHQTGHGLAAPTHSWARIAADYARTPIKPVIDGEPLYEDHPLDFRAAQNGFSFDAHVRQRAYWDVFAGAAGHTYGNHAVWQFYSADRTPVNGPQMYWYHAIRRPGAAQIPLVRKLIESRDYFSRVPDQSLVVDTLTGADHVQATRGNGYAFVYSAQGRPFDVVMGKISGDSVVAYWFNPRSGDALELGRFANTGTQRFTPPSQGFGADWVLVLDDAARRAGVPGR
ncbi:MAG: glycoside hydrolase family 140 protein [Gemmatimonadaceae bacterium]